MTRVNAVAIARWNVDNIFEQFLSCTATIEYALSHLIENYGSCFYAFIYYARPASEGLRSAIRIALISAELIKYKLFGMFFSQRVRLCCEK